MLLIRLDPQTVLFREITPFAASFLRQLPAEADPAGDPAALDRLYSKPMHDGQGREAAELNEEWKQYVEPDLRHLFQSAIQTVSEDLQRLQHSSLEMADTPKESSDTVAQDGDPGPAGTPETGELHIPMNHLEQWVSVLAQARLVMAARNGFTELEMDAELPPAILSIADLKLHQMDFYEEIQHFFLWQLESGEHQ